MVTNAVPAPRTTPWIRLARHAPRNDAALDEAYDQFAAQVLPGLRPCLPSCGHVEFEAERVAYSAPPAPDDRTYLDPRYGEAAGRGGDPEPVEPRHSPVPPIRRRSVDPVAMSPEEQRLHTADQKREARNKKDRTRRLNARRIFYSQNPGQKMSGPWGKV